MRTPWDSLFRVPARCLAPGRTSPHTGTCSAPSSLSRRCGLGPDDGDAMPQPLQPSKDAAARDVSRPTQGLDDVVDTITCILGDLSNSSLGDESSQHTRPPGRSTRRTMSAGLSGGLGVRGSTAPGTQVRGGLRGGASSLDWVWEGIRNARSICIAAHARHPRSEFNLSQNEGLHGVPEHRVRMLKRADFEGRSYGCAAGASCGSWTLKPRAGHSLAGGSESSRSTCRLVPRRGCCPCGAAPFRSCV